MATSTPNPDLGPAHALVHHMVHLGVEKFDAAAYTAVSDSITKTIPPTLVHSTHGQSLLHPSSMHTFTHLAGLRKKSDTQTHARILACTMADVCEATVRLTRAMCPSPDYIKMAATMSEIPHSMDPVVQASLLYGRAAKVLAILEQLQVELSGICSAALMVVHVGDDLVLNPEGIKANLPFVKTPLDVINESITAIQLLVTSLATEMSVAPDDTGLFVTGASSGAQARTKVGHNLESCAMRCMGCLRFLCEALAKKPRNEFRVESQHVSQSVEVVVDMARPKNRSNNAKCSQSVTTLKLCGAKLVRMCSEFVAYVTALLLMGDHCVRETRSQPLHPEGQDYVGDLQEEAMTVNGVSLPEVALLNAVENAPDTITTVQLQTDWVMPFCVSVRVVVEQPHTAFVHVSDVVKRVTTNYNEGPRGESLVTSPSVLCAVLALLVCDDVIREEASHMNLLELKGKADASMPSEVLTYLGKADGIMPLHSLYGVHACWLAVVAAVRCAGIV